MASTLRHRPDGSVLVIRADEATLQQLNRTHWRGSDNEWFPRKDLLAIDLRPGDEVVVYAKGPSLDRFPGCELPSFGINEAAIVKRTNYAIALDRGPFLNFQQAGYDGHVIAQAGNHEAEHFTRTAWFRWGVDTTPGFETAPVLLELLGKMGVRRVLAVGFDAYPSGIAGPQIYARSVNEAGAHPRDNEDYAPINRHIDEAVTRSRLSVEWWHLQPSPTTNTST